MIDQTSFTTYSIRTSPAEKTLTCILHAAIEAADPGKAVQKNLIKNGKTLLAGSKSYDLTNIKRIRLIAFGKAALPMTVATAAILDSNMEGVCIHKAGSPYMQPNIPGIKILESSHPTPDQRSLIAGQEITCLLSDSHPDDLVLVLISGGGSSLIASPVSGITLQELQEFNNVLLACGADIERINILRRHIDRLKGGRLAQLAAPAIVITLILSDVIGDPLEAIASGPTVPDPSTFADAIEILESFHIIDNIPSAIVEHYKQGQAGNSPETPKPGDQLFNNTHSVLVGSNAIAANAAMEEAIKAGYNTKILTNDLQGEAQQAGKMLASILREMALHSNPLKPPALLIAGGESTVTLGQRASITDRPGLGGRNQEVALAAVADLAELKNILLITLATDGEDGPTDAAGAVATGETCLRAVRAGIDPSEYLIHHDAYHFFDRLDDLLKPGPTFTNLNDLNFLFAL